MKGIYIIIGIAVLGLVALWLFKKDPGTATENGDGIAGNDDTAANQGGGWIFGQNFGSSFGTTRQQGQSFGDWFNNRQQQGWSFNTKIA